MNELLIILYEVTLGEDERLEAFNTAYRKFEWSISLNDNVLEVGEEIDLIEDMQEV
ncbi:hypothetical protein [Lysinibacillus capsici]|uniref:hypothetical protein n=1 Tax=Lysinibacillus capsici TaxID=2115968 RepID=UPI0034E58131